MLNLICQGCHLDANDLCQNDKVYTVKYVYWDGSRSDKAGTSFILDHE